mgnify:CR=1 FL=1|jgi:hypothetical protein
MVKFIESKTQPDPVTCKYWVDLFENPYGGSIKYFNGESWVKISDESADLSSIKNQLSNKVDKVSGKGLSTNDYTTEEKQKLAGIAAQANKTTVENVLTSTSTTNALSAAQGKALKDALNALTARVTALETPAA